MSIKYYQLAKGEELPDEFCVVKDINGEPSEYTFYVPDAESYELLMRTMSLEAALEGMHLIREQDIAENERLREFASEAFSMAFNFYHGAGTAEDLRELKVKYRELGVETDNGTERSI